MNPSADLSADLRVTRPRVAVLEAVAHSIDDRQTLPTRPTTGSMNPDPPTRAGPGAGRPGSGTLHG
jgi:hypothetical protein